MLIEIQPTSFCDYVHANHKKINELRLTNNKIIFYCYFLYKGCFYYMHVFILLYVMHEYAFIKRKKSLFLRGKIDARTSELNKCKVMNEIVT